MSKSPTQVGTNTTTNAPPAYVQAAQQNLLGTAQNLTSPFTQYQPNYMVAGFTPDQTMAFDLARYQAAQAFANPAGGDLSKYGSYTAAPATANAASLGPAAQAQAASAQAAMGPAASQLGANDIRSLFNPYQEDVVNTTTQQLSDANARQLAAIRARQAAESAYGGNRGALQESEQNRNFGNTLAQTVAALNQGGWNTAANLGMQNVGMRQQTGLANQQAQQQTNLANLSAAQQTALANQAATNQQAQLLAQLQQQANLFNAGNQQQTNLFNGQQTLNAAAMQNNLANADWQRQMQALQSLLGIGGQQQQLAQQAINVPWTGMNYLAGVTPGNYGSSSSQPIYGPSTFQTAASLAPLGIAALGSLSDKTMKKDMTKMGMDPRTGLDTYAFRYKGDPANSPKVVGPMAQDVEKKYPGSTMRVGGKMVITPPARKMLGI